MYLKLLRNRALNPVKRQHAECVHASRIPAVVYGAGKTPQSLSLSHKDIIHTIENEAVFSHILTLKVDGKAEKVVIKSLQRHPSKPAVLHVDFQASTCKTRL